MTPCFSPDCPCCASHRTFNERRDAAILLMRAFVSAHRNRQFEEKAKLWAKLNEAMNTLDVRPA